MTTTLLRWLFILFWLVWSLSEIQLLGLMSIYQEVNSEDVLFQSGLPEPKENLCFEVLMRVLWSIGF